MTEIAWHEFEKKLRSFVRRRIDDGRTDDVVSDILLRLVQTREKLEVARNPMAWVYRVATNVIIDHHRKFAREKTAMTTAALETQANGVAAADGPSEAAELAQCLLPMIENLPKPHGEALRVTEIEGLTQAAAAKKLGLSVSGMKSRVQRARKQLKSALLRCCTIDFDSRGDIFDYRQNHAVYSTEDRQSASSNASGEDTNCCAPAACNSS
jgi:RNA polymerase sigma-70 factor (ECF subfamily)